MIAKLTQKDFSAKTRRWLEAHPGIELISKVVLFQRVVEEYYPGEDYDRLMAVIAVTELSQSLDSHIRKDLTDPDRWGFCGVRHPDQQALFAGDETQSPNRYLLPDGRVAPRDQVSIPFGLTQKTHVYEGIEKKLNAVALAMKLDKRIIEKARNHGIDPETVTYAAPEEASQANEQAA